MPTEMLNLDGLSRPAPTEPAVFVSRIRGVSGQAICAGFGVKAVIDGEETYRIGGRTRVVGDRKHEESVLTLYIGSNLT